MSTLAYAAFTTNRESAPPNTSTTEKPPGVGTYVDALAALVPAEALTLHALIISVTTKTAEARTEITAPETLFLAFIGLIVLTSALYIIPRLIAKRWDKFDYIRMFIPPLAFLGWTMLQRATAFDAIAARAKNPLFAEEAARTVIALFLGAILAYAAATLAYRADQKNPGNN